MRRGRSAKALVLSVLLVGLAADWSLARQPGQGAGADRLSRDWKQVRSRHFVVAGNGPAEELRRTATELAAFQAVLQEMFPSVRLASPVPTVILVLKDNESFRRFQPRDARGRREEWVAGYFTARPDVNYMVTGWRDEDGLSLDVMFHEFTHYVLDRNLAHVPLWLGEGVAEFYSTFRIDTGKNLTLVGETPRLRLPLLRMREPLPLGRMLGNETAAQLLASDFDRPYFYAQSWALVHYLFMGQRGARTRQIGAYLDALDKGRSLEEAFAQAFRCTEEELGRELTKYINDRQFSVLAIKRAAGEGEAAAAEPMREADAEALQADVLSRIGALDEAEKAANRALAAQATHPQARLAVARVRRQQERRDEAIALLQPLAAEEGGDRFAARMELGNALLAAGRLQEARVEAGRAVAANGEVPSAHYLLALSAAAAGQESEAEAAMSRLLQLHPSADYYRQRAYDLFAFGKDAAAARDVDTFITRAGWGQESAVYTAFLGALARRRLDQASAADELLRGARQVVPAPGWAAKVLDFLQGRRSAEDLLSQAKQDGEKTEAHTYIGFRDALAGQTAAAVGHFRWVKEKGSRNYVEYPIAVAELERLEKVKPR